MIAEDSTLLREGLVRLLAEEGHEVLGAFGDAGPLPQEMARRLPDVVVLDIRMPPTHTDEGPRAALEIRERWPEVGVLLLSRHIERTYAAQLLASSAERVGYLLKDRVAQVEEFLDALDRIHAGEEPQHDLRQAGVVAHQRLQPADPGGAEVSGGVGGRGIA